MQAVVSVANTNGGFVTSGQKAKIKLVHYPFQEYGMVKEAVSHISPDSTEAQPQGEAKQTPGAEKPKRT